VAAGSILFAAQQQCAASNATSTSPT